MKHPRLHHFFHLFSLLAVIAASAESIFADVPLVQPAQAAMSAEKLASIDGIVDAAIKNGQLPGCVVAIGRRGKLAWLRAYGHRQLQPEAVAMTTDTVFDLASLTKPIATATSVMVLVEQGKLRVRDDVSRYVHEFSKDQQKDITLKHLLTHQAGLIPDNSIKDYEEGKEAALKNLWKQEPRWEPGERFVYSDVGFLMLGDLVERASQQPLDQFALEQIFKPLGMQETTYNPGPELRARAAPTEKRNDQWMVGEVHDPRAYRMGGVAGHAGLFSTAKDLAIYADMMLRGGRHDDTRIFSKATVRWMTRPVEVSSGRRALGWDVLTGYSSNRGENFSRTAFGHGGFTGTAMWIDPQLNLFVVFLSNRLHPNGKGSVNRLAGRIGSIAAGAIEDL